MGGGKGKEIARIASGILADGGGKGKKKKKKKASPLPFLLSLQVGWRSGREKKKRGKGGDQPWRLQPALCLWTT